MSSREHQVSLLDPSALGFELSPVGSGETSREASPAAAEESRGSAEPSRSANASPLPAGATDPPRGPGASCWWCEGTIPAGRRRDAETCRKACRQARSRFRVGRALGPIGAPMRWAYADPPYPGLARKYYGSEASEVDHAALVSRLQEGFDGWALSTSAEALPDVLRLCPPGAWVAAWVRGCRPTKSRSALTAWEPVIIYGNRPLPDTGVPQDLCDVLLSGARQRSHPDALIGMKSAAFAEWVFRLLGARQGDTLADIFPGSGIISRAWEEYVSRVDRRGSLPSCLAGASRRLLSLADGE